MFNVIDKIPEDYVLWLCSICMYHALLNLVHVCHKLRSIVFHSLAHVEEMRKHCKESFC